MNLNGNHNESSSSSIRATLLEMRAARSSVSSMFLKASFHGRQERRHGRAWDQFYLEEIVEQFHLQCDNWRQKVDFPGDRFISFQDEKETIHPKWYSTQQPPPSE